MLIIQKNGKQYYQFMIHGIKKYLLCRCRKTKINILKFKSKNKIENIYNEPIGKENFITCRQIFDDYKLYSKVNNKDNRNVESRLAIIKNYFPDEMKLAETTAVIN